MSVCVSIKPNGAVYIDTATPLPDCQFLLVDQTDLTTLTGLSDLFAQYFGFDLELFSLIVGACLVTFATGHVLGRMMQAWRKVM